jgi:membrane-associated HD superfamily phosphohydrolase
MSETVIASIMYLIKKNKDVKIDYDKLIDEIFNKRIEDGSLKEYAITFAEYDRMKDILKKEKLYYDFLR